MRSLGSVAAEEMWKTFNMGIGFVLVVAARQASTVPARLAAAGIEHAVIGRIVEGASGVEFAD